MASCELLGFLLPIRRNGVCQTIAYCRSGGRGNALAIMLHFFRASHCWKPEMKKIPSPPPPHGGGGTVTVIFHHNSFLNQNLERLYGVDPWPPPDTPDSGRRRSTSARCLERQRWAWGSGGRAKRVARSLALLRNHSCEKKHPQSYVFKRADAKATFEIAPMLKAEWHRYCPQSGNWMQHGTNKANLSTRLYKNSV